jgi:hypothetical protein
LELIVDLAPQDFVVLDSESIEEIAPIILQNVPCAIFLCLSRIEYKQRKHADL